MKKKNPPGKVSAQEYTILSKRTNPTKKKLGLKTRTIINCVIISIFTLALAYYFIFIDNILFTKQPDLKYVRAKYNNSVIREGNGIEFPAISRINKKSKLVVLNENDSSWIQVKDNSGNIGWINKEEVDY